MGAIALFVFMFGISVCRELIPKKYLLVKGPLIYDPKVFKYDKEFLENIGGHQLNINFFEKNNSILDKGDTLEMKRFLQKKNLSPKKINLRMAVSFMN